MRFFLTLECQSILYIKNEIPLLRIRSVQARLKMTNFYLISKEVNLKLVPSNNPLSDNFKEGITNSAIKDKLI
jgi:hypothetical protein